MLSLTQANCVSNLDVIHCNEIIPIANQVIYTTGGNSLNSWAENEKPFLNGLNKQFLQRSEIYHLPPLITFNIYMKSKKFPLMRPEVGELRFITQFSPNFQQIKISKIIEFCKYQVFYGGQWNKSLQPSPCQGMQEIFLLSALSLFWGWSALVGCSVKYKMLYLV